VYFFRSYTVGEGLESADNHRPDADKPKTSKTQKPAFSLATSSFKYSEMTRLQIASISMGVQTAHSKLLISWYF
jgi:hypothetical protein